MSSHRQAPPTTSAHPSAARVGIGERVGAAAAAAASIAVLAAAAWTTPDPDGHGTHTQLGLPPCPWAQALDWPCATCGMTTAVSLAAHGHFADAFLTQPAGALGAILLAALFWGFLHVAATGSSLGRMYGRLVTPRMTGWGVAVLLAAWAYKAAVWRAG
ncbi:MAG: DUF2752 domain-containing protein [Phycisphaeraceae bacterium]|nr:DUF2752 domain-containing protein [Phycisphaeraceae bacterium]